MIKTPPGWGVHVLGQTLHSVSYDLHWAGPAVEQPPVVRRIGFDDLGWALQRGWEDFVACRADVVFLCLLYPLIGLVLARVALGSDLLPLVFPLAAGFALLGPLAGVGLNEMSRRREQGEDVGWADTFAIMRSPAFGRILLLGLLLLVMFLFWMVVSQAIYSVTLGPQPPVSVAAFVHDVLLTPAGWTMAAVGIGLGFVIALVAFCISVVSFPLLLDQPVPVGTAIQTSIRAVRRNKVTMLSWAALIAALLVLASLPALLGLVIVLPVLGHATWHLYRRVVQEA